MDAENHRFSTARRSRFQVSVEMLQAVISKNNGDCQTRFSVQGQFAHSAQLVPGKQDSITRKETKATICRSDPDLARNNMYKSRLRERQLSAIMDFFFTGHEDFGDFHR